jgi:hypothetical protein
MPAELLLKVNLFRTLVLPFGELLDPAIRRTDE